MKKLRLGARAPAGFTLLEVLVVLVIVGVTMTISAGRIHQLIIQNRIARAATAVRNDLEAAFALAVRNRRPTRIAWSSSDMQLSVTDRPGTDTLRHTQLGRDAYGLTASAVTVSSSPVEVFPNGIANNTLTITLSMEHITKQVIMSRAGMVQVK